MASVDNFVFNLPKAEQQIVQHVRALVKSVDDRVEEKLSYGVPYFYRHRRVMFLWPASAPMGPKDCLVSIGFCYGNLLSNDEGLLLFDGRKQVGLIKASTLMEVNNAAFVDIVKEAILTDEFLHTRKTKS